MRRPLLIGLLAMGTVLGFGSGFSHMRRCGMARHEAFEQHIAQVCVNAAREATPAVISVPASAPAPAAIAPAPAAPAPTTVSPTTIYVVPSLMPGYPVGQPVPGYIVPNAQVPSAQTPVVVVPTAPAQTTPQPAVPATKP
jgi:hypothetical protein